MVAGERDEARRAALAERARDEVEQVRSRREHQQHAGDDEQQLASKAGMVDGRRCVAGCDRGPARARRSSPVSQLDRDRGSFAAADAQRRDAALQPCFRSAPSSVTTIRAPRRADRVAERAGAAVDVDLVVRQPSSFIAAIARPRKLR